MPVKHIHSPGEVLQIVTTSGDKLVVIDFMAKWCQPCHQIAPFVEELSNKYPDVTFLKVDTDELKSVAQECKVTAMPTFQFYKGGAKVDELVGANPTRLEALVKQISGSTPAAPAVTIPGGYRELSEFIEMAQVNCLNEHQTHTAKSMLSKTGKLKSDCDEQLLIEILFHTPVKIHSIRVVTKDKDLAPKDIKLFVNRAKLGFNEVEDVPSQQDLSLTPKDIGEDALIPLKFVKFQKISNLQIFVENNQGGGELTEIDSLQFFGITEESTNMKNFQKVQHE
jgi:thioredoxin